MKVNPTEKGTEKFDAEKKNLSRTLREHSKLL